MFVTISGAAKEKIYHFEGCCHEKRIKDANKMVMGKNKAKKYGYRPCKCCRHMVLKYAGKDETEKACGKKQKLNIEYCEKTKALFIRTFNGFWKTCWEEGEGFILYHLNQQDYDGGQPAEFLKTKGFHRQSDVCPTESLTGILNYIDKHDKAKAIIAEDYRNLPRRTKKERKYFNIAKKKAEKERFRRVDDLFAAIERDWAARGMTDWKNTAVCGC